MEDIRALEKQLLEKLLAERMELDQQITFLQKRIGIIPSNENNSPAATISPARELPTVNKGEFFGMSRAEAAVALLRKVKRTMSTNDIFDTLAESGLDMSGKNAMSALYTALMRHTETRRVAKNTWGLKEWYPHLKDPKKKNGSPTDKDLPSTTQNDQENEKIVGMTE